MGWSLPCWRWEGWSPQQLGQSRLERRLEGQPFGLRSRARQGCAYIGLVAVHRGRRPGRTRASFGARIGRRCGAGVVRWTERIVLVPMACDARFCRPREGVGSEGSCRCSMECRHECGAGRRRRGGGVIHVSDPRSLVELCVLGFDAVSGTRRRPGVSERGLDEKGTVRRGGRF